MEGTEGVLTVPTGFCVVSFGGYLRYSLSSRKRNLPLLFHPDKGNYSAPHCSVNYKGLLSGVNARDCQVLAREGHLRKLWVLGG